MANQVPNKNIDNSSGQVVRLDIQNTLKAVAANNFGSLNDAGTLLPAEFVADNSSSPKKLLIRATSGGDVANQNHTTVSERATLHTVGNLDEENLGLLPKAGGTMTGQLLGDDASLETAPAYAFDNDPDTGIYRKSANKLGIACGGSQIANFEDAGLLINSVNSNRKKIFLNDSSNSNHVALTAPNNITTNFTLTLPDSVTNGGFLRTDGSGQLSFQVIAGVPTGAIFAFPNDGAANATGYDNNGVPLGYLECAGQEVSRTDYSVLFGILQTKYGAGNGSTTFNLPDLRGEFIRGYSHGRSNVDVGRGIGSFQSTANLSHNHSATTTTGSTLSNLSHGHGIEITHTSASTVASAAVAGHDPRMGLVDYSDGAFNVRYTTQTNNLSNASVSSTSSTSIANDGATEARPRNIAMMYIIKI